MTYGCYNKPRPTEESGYLAQSGYGEPVNENWGNFSRQPIYVEVKHVMSTTCMYDKSDSDKGCKNCCWAKEENE